MEEEYMSYSVFTVQDRNGNDVELAAVDEFEYDGRHYVVGAKIEGDAISEEGVYIYRAKLINDEIVAEKITDMKEYDKVVEKYMEMA